MGKSSIEMKQVCNSEDCGRQKKQREAGPFQAGMRHMLQHELAL
jgi:hypothetical protein